MVTPPSTPGEISTPAGSGNNQTEVPTTTGTAPLISTDFFTFGCSNQAAGIKDLWGGNRISSSYLNEFFGMTALLDFFHGRVFANKKSYIDLLNERLGSPESITGVFTFNFTGTAEVFRFAGNETGDISKRYLFVYTDLSGTEHKSWIYNNGQNTDKPVTDCKPNSLAMYLGGDAGELIYFAEVQASADFHIMWVFTPATPSS